MALIWSHFINPAVGRWVADVSWRKSPPNRQERQPTPVTLNRSDCKKRLWGAFALVLNAGAHNSVSKPQVLIERRTRTRTNTNPNGKEANSAVKGPGRVRGELLFRMYEKVITYVTVSGNFDLKRGFKKYIREHTPAIFLYFRQGPVYKSTSRALAANAPL
jgi:hypothetical protein